MLSVPNDCVFTHLECKVCLTEKNYLMFQKGPLAKRVIPSRKCIEMYPFVEWTPRRGLSGFVKYATGNAKRHDVQYATPSNWRPVNSNKTRGRLPVKQRRVAKLMPSMKHQSNFKRFALNNERVKTYLILFLYVAFLYQVGVEGHLVCGCIGLCCIR